MRIVCAWCNKDMGEKDGKGVGGVSHGLCVENGIMTCLVIAEDTEEIKANAKKPGSKVCNLRSNHFSTGGN